MKRLGLLKMILESIKDKELVKCSKILVKKIKTLLKRGMIKDNKESGKIIIDTNGTNNKL